MTELLKVLKFLLKREKKRVFRLIHRVKMYKGLYAFLSGIVIFSVCFAGKGENGIYAYNGTYIAVLLPAAASGDFTGFTELTSNIELSDKPVLLSESETLTNAKANQEIKAQRVPYNVFPASYAVNQGAGSALESINKDDKEDLNGDISLLSVRDNEISAENTLSTPEETSKEDTDTAETAEPEPETENGSEDISEDNTHESEQEETAEKWLEKEASGIKYVNTDLIYSRKEAVEGSEKINRYRINDAVEVEAVTDTHYYKLKSGEFIHEDYLSDRESPKWTESPAEGVMYVRKSGVYSREEALEGSVKVNQYCLNDTVTVTALTDTDYYKLAEGEFIHSDFLSPTEVVDYPLSDQYGQRAQTSFEQELSRQVFDVVNAVRAEYGLSPFKQLDSLDAAAAERAWETTVYNSHTRPDGSRCFTVLGEYGLGNPSTKAENIAKWYSSAQSVVNAWMSDYAHRSAILGDHEYMGAGCYYVAGDYYGYYWAQIFYSP